MAENENKVTISFTCSTYDAGVLMVLYDILTMPIDRDFNGCGNAGVFGFPELMSEITVALPKWIKYKNDRLGWGRAADKVMVRKQAEEWVAAATEIDDDD